MFTKSRTKSDRTLSRREFVGAGVAGITTLSIAQGKSLRTSSPVSFTPDVALATARARRVELVDLLSALIAVRSHSGEEAREAQSLVVDYLKKLRYSVEISEDRPSEFVDHAEFMPPTPAGDGPFVNVVARPPGGPGANLAMFAHIDTHLVEDGWNTDPYEAAISNGRLYGLGAADDKGGIAAMLVAAAALSEARGAAPIVISSHGKGGGSRGSLPVFDRLKRSGEEIDAVLYAHPAETGRGFADIKHVVRGVLDLTLIVTGWKGKPLEIGLPDSALWEDGGDALEACLQAITHLKNGVLRRTDVNVGALEAGDAAGAIPDVAKAEIRILFDGEQSWRELMNSIEREVKSYSANLPRGSGTFRLSVESKGMRSNPGAVLWDAPACRALRSAIEKVTGAAPSAYPNHYGGDIRYPIRLLGAPAFGIGSIAGNFYGPNEWVDIDDLVRLVGVLILTMSAWAKL